MFGLTLLDLLGIIGLGALLIPYLMILLDCWKMTDYKFYLFNILGAGSLLINGILTPLFIIYPILNAVWTIGTIFQLIKEYLRRKKNR